MRVDWRAPLAAGLVVATLFAGVGPASADDASEARFFDALARRSFEQNDYRRALERFLLAYTAAPSPALAYNVAVCAELLGESRMAFTYFARYIEQEDGLSERRAHAQEALERLRPQLRIVRVTSEPSGATVYLDTLERGAFGRTPVEVALQPDEAHEVLLVREGFLDASEPVSAQTPGGTEVRVQLVPRTGSVRFDLEPEHASLQVLRGSERVAEAEGDGPIELPIGQYRVRVEAPGHAADERLLVVGEQGTQEMSIRLVALPTRTGLLLVSAGDVDAHVMVDGRRMGRVPLRLPGVLVGRRHVQVVADDGRVRDRDVDLRAGDAVHVEVSF